VHPLATAAVAAQRSGSARERKKGAAGGAAEGPGGDGDGGDEGGGGVGLGGARALVSGALPLQLHDVGPDAYVPRRRSRAAST
jgi:hypothetical protein